MVKNVSRSSGIHHKLHLSESFIRDEKNLQDVLFLDFLVHTIFDFLGNLCEKNPQNLNVSAILKGFPLL